MQPHRRSPDPEHVPSPKTAARDGGGEDDEDRGDSQGTTGDGGGGAASPTPGAGGATRFYAQFDLDPVRGIKQLGEILQHVTARLGSGVELSLEVRAEKADGFDDATQRIVSENATNLGAKGAEFES